MTKGRYLRYEAHIQKLLDEIKSEQSMKYRINRDMFHNHNFLDGYYYGLSVAMQIIAGTKIE